ncbi:undecaprenyl-diphosphatase [Paenibacillus athensensis]|uniref:Phosphatidic acid phosphatase type 2/haloperoxidase domain-containing protein n=1 Tax=Paenibacillus athensensis TaxID=1967502 RepID=A0A4Y8QBI6_9BACL|nr:undecaprenyl-diphosphatase [Paenibacillus athensensis]MCD1257673.1 undecaprenyl-diphosphatase [Paenibacillus athensensis]
MDLNEIDYQLFSQMNAWGDAIPMLNPLMRFFAQDGEYVFFAGMLIYWFSRRATTRNMVVEAVLSACIALGASGLLGHFFYRDRPFVTHHVLQLVAHSANASFPSDHATGAFAIATAFCLYRKKGSALWLTLAGGIAFSRVWVGVHYPIDVFAGAVLGMVTAVGVHQLLQRSDRMKKLIVFCIGIYETLEGKVWSRTNQSLNK